MTDAPRPTDTPRFRFQFSIASLLVLTTWTAIVLSLLAVHWVVAAAAAFLTLPPLVLASLVSGWRQAVGDRLSGWEKAGIAAQFLSAHVIVLGIAAMGLLLTGGIALLLVITVVAFAPPSADWLWVVPRVLIGAPVLGGLIAWVVALVFSVRHLKRTHGLAIVAQCPGDPSAGNPFAPRAANTDSDPCRRA